MDGVLHTTARAEDRGRVEENQLALYLARRRRGVVAATPRTGNGKVIWTEWLTKRAPENRMQCLQGGEVWCKPDVANDERRIIVIVLPLWSKAYCGYR